MFLKPPNAPNLAERRKMAVALRRFGAGRSTVDEFEAVWDNVEDPACFEAGYFAWLFYDDFRTKRLVGKWKLLRESREHWAKWVLFLLTNKEAYDEAKFKQLKGESRNMKLRQLLRLRRPSPSPYDKAMRAYWPINSQEELDRAKAIKNPFALS